MEDTMEFIRKWNAASAKDGLKKMIEFKALEAADERTLDIARNLLSLDVDIKDIAKATGLSIEELNNLKNS